jgi:D-alanine--poly(phosphoribitol) ligase subunit 2
MEDVLTLQTEIAKLLASLNVDVGSFQDDLIESGLLDSLKIVELLVELELQFEMTIPVNELEIDAFRSVTRIADFVVKHQGVKAVPSATASA